MEKVHTNLINEDGLTVYFWGSKLQTRITKQTRSALKRGRNWGAMEETWQFTNIKTLTLKLALERRQKWGRMEEWRARAG